MFSCKLYQTNWWWKKCFILFWKHLFNYNWLKFVIANQFKDNIRMRIWLESLLLGQIFVKVWNDYQNQNILSIQILNMFLFFLLIRNFLIMIFIPIDIFYLWIRCKIVFFHSFYLFLFLYNRLVVYHVLHYLHHLVVLFLMHVLHQVIKQLV